MALASLLFAASASANTITVDSTADTSGDVSICTLRDAIKSANYNSLVPPPAFGNCASGSVPNPDNINFSLGSGQHTIQLTSVLPSIANDTTITGPGAGLLTIRGQLGTADYTVMPIEDEGTAPFPTVTLEGMTITHGSKGISVGAAIALTLNGVTVSGNTFTDTQAGTSIVGGAGITSGTASVTINDSTISGNSATANTTGPGTFGSVFTFARGGAIDISGSGALSINTSTISGNLTTANGNQTAEADGAIYDDSANVTITRSTISGNSTAAAVSEADGPGSSRAAGGGIFLSGGANQLSLDRATVSGNSANATASQGGDGNATGGGIILVQFGSTLSASSTGSTIASNAVSGSGSGSVLGSNVDTSIADPASFTSENTIFAAGTGAANCFQEGSGGFSSGGYNIDSGTSCLGTPATGDQVNTLTGLGSLQDNGGVQGNGDPILTRAPALNSAAVDKGTNTGIDATTDQRGSGFARTFDMGHTTTGFDGTDIGAFEQQVSASPTTHDFGDLQWGTTSASQPFTMKNRTGNALPAGTVLTGTNAADFQTSNDNCTNTAVPNKTDCTLDVAFHPVTAGDGARSGSLTFSVSPVQLASVTGNATGFTPAGLNIGPASHDFGSTQAGTPTGAFQFTVSNDGLGTSGPMSVTLTGANASDFGITSNTCAGQSLAGSGTCTISVRLAPSSEGAKTASLNISGTPGGTTSGNLTGSATAPPAPPASGPTGQQAAALKKCKKKKSAKARKKCKQKAKKLPV